MLKVRMAGRRNGGEGRWVPPPRSAALLANELWSAGSDTEQRGGGDDWSLGGYVIAPLLRAANTPRFGQPADLPGEAEAGEIRRP
jgi:hypothetical protein